MGFISGLIGGNFKYDDQGGTIFYPNGVVGVGRIISDKNTERQVRRFLKAYYFFIFSSVLIAFISGNERWYLAIPPMPIVYYLSIYKLLEDCPRTDQRLSLNEAMAGSARAHSFLSLWVLFAAAAGSLLIIVYRMFAGSERCFEHPLALVITGATALVTVAFGSMLWTKHIARL